MGMFWIAVAAAAYKKSHGGRRCHKTSNGEVRYSYDDVNNKVVTHTYYDCVLSEIYGNQDEDLYKTFKSLADAYLSKIDSKIKATEEVVKDKAKEYDGSLKLYNGFIGNIFENEEEYLCFKNLVESSNSIDEFYRLLDSRIDNYYRYMEGDLESLSKGNEEIEKFKKRKLLSLTNKHFWKTKIEDKEDHQNIVKNNMGYHCDQITIYENIKYICKENTNLIHAAIHEQLGSRIIKSELNRVKDDLSDLRRQGNGYGFNYSIIEEVFEEKVNSGEITENKLQKLYLLLDKVEIKGRRGEYSFIDTRSNDLLPKIVKWFVQNVYELDPEFVNRNIDLLENEDVSLKRTKKDNN